MDHLRCIPFYVGCQTSKGQLIGISDDSLLIRPTHNQATVENYEIGTVGTAVILHLKKLSDLTHEESIELINNGFNIGRPKGYSFSPEAFLFLVKLHVDLFGLIQHGFAMDLKSIDRGATKQ
jgi:hypothetical protein